MKTCNLSLATVVLGALAVSYSACSAQGQDNTVPGGTSAPRAGSSSDTAGSSSNSTGGAPPVVTGSGGSPVHPSAGGPPASVAGSFNTGVGGSMTSSAGSKGGGTAGTATGGAGAPATTGGCLAAVGAATEVLIDDLEDGDNAIRPIGSRIGYWYTYNDGTGTQVPAPTALFKGTAPGSTTSPMFAATTSGPAFTSYGAGMGFDFNNTASKSCPYNASAYTGIKFYAKANTGNMAMMALKAMIKIPATTPTTADSGACAAKCEDHFYLKPAPVLTATWTQYTMPFASIAQDGFGTATTFDKTKILAMQFQVATNVKFDFSVDDITFY
jgi:hypothetical protein